MRYEYHISAAQQQTTAPERAALERFRDLSGKNVLFILAILALWIHRALNVIVGLFGGLGILDRSLTSLYYRHISAAVGAVPLLAVQQTLYENSTSRYIRLQSSVIRVPVHSRQRG